MTDNLEINVDFVNGELLSTAGAAVPQRRVSDFRLAALALCHTVLAILKRDDVNASTEALVLLLTILLRWLRQQPELHLL